MDANCSVAMPSRTPRGIVVAMALVLLLNVAVRWETDSRLLPQDDAFITYRYAANLAAGKGLVYNVGEHLQATTTPLYACLLAAFSRFGHIPFISRGVAVGADAVSCLLVMLITGIVTGNWWWGLLPGLLWTLSGYQARVCSTGMETSLFTAALLGATLAYERRRFDMAVGIAAWLPLLRPEGLLFAPLATLGAVRERVVPRKGLLLVAIVWTGWALFAYSYYGGLVPHSVTAKADYTFHGQTVIGGDATSDLRDRFAIDKWSLLVAPALVLGAVRFAAVAPCLLWGTAFAAAYLIANPFMYIWYLGPLHAVMLLWVSLAVVAGWREMCRHVTSLSSAVDLRQVLWLVVFASAVFGVKRFAGRDLLEMDYNHRVSYHVDSRAVAGRWIRRHTPPDAFVFVDDVGNTGFYDERRTYDAYGLVWRYPPGWIYKSPPTPDPWPFFAIDDYHPDVIARVELFSPPEEFVQQMHAKGYRLALPGSTEVWVRTTLPLRQE